MFIKHLRRSVLLIVISYSLFTACDSALSDVEFNDPSIIRPHINVSREVTIEEGLVTELSVLIADKNMMLVELKNGEVIANSMNLILDTLPLPPPFDSIFQGGKYYVAPESFPEITFNTDYEIEIIMSDDEGYISEVTTQHKAYGFFNVPQIHFSQTAMNINWEVINPYETTISIKYTYTLNGVEEDYSDSFSISEDGLETGSFTLDSYCFKEASEPYDAIIKIENHKPGEINPAFREGSSIQSIYSIEKKSRINPR